MSGWQLRVAAHGHGTSVCVCSRLCTRCATVRAHVQNKPRVLPAQDDFFIFEVFSEVCQAVAHMHRQSPPLAHRWVVAVGGWRVESGGGCSVVQL